MPNWTEIFDKKTTVDEKIHVLSSISTTRRMIKESNTLEELDNKLADVEESITSMLGV